AVVRCFSVNSVASCEALAIFGRFLFLFILQDPAEIKELILRGCPKAERPSPLWAGGNAAVRINCPKPYLVTTLYNDLSVAPLARRQITAEFG
ncbi:MAG TPA: hypothetical protein VGM62_09100, partial [Chthoniobacterales bacterium]